MNYSDVRHAVGGQQIVYINLAGNLEAMATNIVKAMQDTDVKCVIAISSIGIYLTPLKPVLVPYNFSLTEKNSELHEKSQEIEAQN